METDLLQRPIGIFDSGIGGLTVAKTLSELLPNERLVYFGDTAHAPWGDKSSTAIQSYSVAIADLLLKHHCKMIIIACHTASTTAYETVRKHVAGSAQVINTVDPIIQHFQEGYENQKIGLIGTKQTIHSNAYKKHVDNLNQNIELCALATPLLAPLIEEGMLETQATELIVAHYLSNPILQDIRALILGCTHYPLLKKLFQNHYPNSVKILDPSELCAQFAKNFLQQRNWLSPKKTHNHLFYLSDYTEFFASTARAFFQHDIHIEPYPLWSEGA